MSRTLTFHIFRCNPEDPASTPHMEDFALNEVAKTNFFEASTSSYQNIGVEGALAFRVATAPLEEP